MAEPKQRHLFAFAKEIDMDCKRKREREREMAVRQASHVCTVRNKSSLLK